jgi:murein DD-endopeptidase MepM/ murein hydrolase activator NlpD
MPRWIRTFFILALWLQASFTPVLAQNQALDQPVYIVQKGDTLNIIALRFGVSSADLIAVNNISDPNSLQIGSRLVIPGLEGVQGILTSQVVPFGETLTTIDRRYQLQDGVLIRLNHLTSPTEFYSGYNLIIPQTEQDTSLKGRAFVSSGQSLLETAVLSGSNPWTLNQYNHLGGSWKALPGERLYFNRADSKAASGSISPSISTIEVKNLPLVQGKTITILIITTEPTSLSGSLAGKELHFFPVETNRYIALQGIHAMAKAGLYPFKIKAALSTGQTYEFEQMVLVRLGYYPQDPPLTVPPETLDPANTKPEDDLIAKTTLPATSEKLWSGIFKAPVDKPICIRSWFGDRRSYNGSDYTYFHTGLDYGVCANLNIYAPARGVVVYTGPLTVRGNATIIDHGWGIYSGIYHQSQILVKVGQIVDVGEKIGIIGATGRVNGPHLHWEVWANGIQVEPEDWLEQAYP